MGKPLRVLLVEDSEDDAELVLDELARGGFEPEAHRVDRLPDLRQALAERDWDVVLSDFNIIDFTAAEALRALQESHRDLPFVILSGAVRAEEAVSLLKLGAHDFLNKDALARLVPAIEREMREMAERTQRRMAEERVRILSLAIEQSPVSVVITDREGRIDYANPKFEQVTGYTLAEARGRDLGFTLIEHAGGNPVDGIRSTVTAGHEWRGEFCNLRRDGQLFWEYATVSPLKDENGQISHFVAVKEDITVRRSYEERLLRQSHYDDLTGLPNRILMLDRLDQAMALAHRNRTQTALLCLDLDHFKNVNDMLGHAIGDGLLKDVAQRLGTVVRESDTLARLGGDEFVIILPGIDDGAEAQRAAQRLQEALSPPFRLDNQDHFVTASIGITLYPLDGEDAQVLLRNADLAMYKAKEIGRDGYRFFTQEISQRLQERLGLEVQLRGAVRRNEMRLHYQPIVDLATVRPVGVEALLRWQRPDGIVMPDTFIPIAEELGLIRELGEWVVGTACGAIDTFGRDLRVAVNVSPRQLREAGFSAAIQRLLAETGLNPDRLEFEITERVLMDDTPETADNLRVLCDLGVRLSIDDFGTGYSSLGYLQKYPFDTLKIDRSFVSQALDNPGAARLVETIIAMAHGLDLQVIAEGVETEAQRDFLRARGCDQAQGYLFARPLPPDQLSPVLAGLADS